MKRKTLLLLTDHQLTAWPWTPEGCAAPHSFSTVAEFDTYLTQHRHPIWMLVDLTEEEFHYEGLPHINDQDHYAAAIQRLASHFPDTPLRMVVKQFKQTQIGKDDEMLYSALTQPTRLAPWLEDIEARRIPLAGIYSAAHLTSLLIKGSELERQLLVTLDADAGLRTSYFYKGRLRFSRLAPGNSLTERAKAEAWQTRPYLLNRRLLPRDQALPLTVLCRDDVWQELITSAPPDPDLPLLHLDITEVAQRLGLSTPLASSDATPLFLHLLATQAPTRQYAPDPLTLRFRQRNTRRTLQVLAALLAAAGILWGASNLWHAQRQNGEIATLRQQAQRLQSQAAQIEQSIGALPASAADIRTTITLLQSLDQAPPQVILTGLAQTLTEFPALQLNKLEWQNDARISTLMLHLITEAEATEQLSQFRLTLTRRGYQVTQLQRGDTTAVLQLRWNMDG